MDGLNAAGLNDDTRIVYTTDHGDNMGTRGAWGKSLMYEEAVSVPLIVVGPDIPAGEVVKTPATIIDVYPFILDCVGERDEQTMPADVPGTSLSELIDGAEPDRVAFSEYHAMGSKSGAFMVRKGDWKLVYYTSYPAQMFNLAQDPEEVNDLADAPEFQDKRAELMAELEKICDPAAVDADARRKQAAMILEPSMSGS